MRTNPACSSSRLRRKIDEDSHHDPRRVHGVFRDTMAPKTAIMAAKARPTAGGPLGCWAKTDALGQHGPVHPAAVQGQGRNQVETPDDRVGLDEDRRNSSGTSPQPSANEDESDQQRVGQRARRGPLWLRPTGRPRASRRSGRRRRREGARLRAPGGRSASQRRRGPFREGRRC